MLLNCDMGEGAGKDASLMPFIDMASIACGFHAGDTDTMQETLQLAKLHGVKAGAHPSFPDRENFGRTEMQCTPAEIRDMVGHQIRLLQQTAAKVGIPLFHVKPHGALYNQAAKDRALADAIAAAVCAVDGRLLLVGLSGSALIAAGKAAGIKTAEEAFADRTYQDDGSLTPRRQSEAVITDEKKAVAQVLQLCLQGTVTALSGKVIPVTADTICIHGDGREPLKFAKAIRAALQQLRF